MSVHLKATGLDNEDLSRLQEEIDKIPNLVDAIQEHLPGEDDVVILGDFNLSPDTQGRLLIYSGFHLKPQCLEHQWLVYHG